MNYVHLLKSRRVSNIVVYYSKLFKEWNNQENAHKENYLLVQIQYYI